MRRQGSTRLLIRLIGPGSSTTCASTRKKRGKRANQSPLAHRHHLLPPELLPAPEERQIVQFLDPEVKLTEISAAVHSKTELLLVFSGVDLCSSPQQDRAIACVFWSRSLQQSTARQSYCLCFLKQISAAVHSKAELLLVLSEADLCSSPRQDRAIACVF
ncbi:hypothetical protein RRG08_049333 [Elysia crispata]|uniref:Uncharacterized protein n=1 Tax=Elysia crispata TaxID=231223 RepID=A0AAE1CEJ9_9GAST|nr:hypothetical protein RRG08_049333 [Elysia crispata]